MTEAGSDVRVAGSGVRLAGSGVTVGGSGVSRAMVAAHRGVATGAAENTIEAFTNAIAVGADMIEFDVRMTRDGELIAFHDARVNGVGVGSLTRDDIESATGADA